jgi:hypothetical protein
VGDKGVLLCPASHRKLPWCAATRVTCPHITYLTTRSAVFLSTHVHLHVPSGPLVLRELWHVAQLLTYNRHYSFLYIDSSLLVRTVRGGLHPAMLLTYTRKSHQAWRRCHVDKPCFWFAAKIPWLAERLSDSERRVTKSVSSIPIIEFIFENFPQFATQDTG